MTKKIIKFSAENKYLILVIFSFLIFIAYYCIKNIKLDAIPDLLDTQVIVYSKWDRSPDIIEDQVTYPIITSLLGAPKVKAIRGYSDFGFSYVYVIFEDGTDIYWARSRVVEYLSKILPKLPEGVQTELGPDATGVGWVYQYALIDKTGKHSLTELRSYQDWFLKYQLQQVAGVSEVASIGGFVKQYQINIDPHLLVSYKIPLSKVIEAVKNSNYETGARLVEVSGAEYMVRLKGYIKSIKDIENTVISTSENGVPILIKNVASVSIGPEIRRGISDLDGEGDAVGGIIVMRHRENALDVIKRVKQKINDLKPYLPDGVEIVTTYDRSDLILRAIDTLKKQLKEELIIVSLVILLFLCHIPSAIVPILTIPVSIMLTFILMYIFDINSNIMSVSGIAISIGVLVDGAIVEVENAYKKLERWKEKGGKEDFHKVRLEALMEIGPSVFFSLLVIAVAFLPIFTLIDQEGRLFRPLAWTKTFTMFIASFLALTFDPAVRMIFTRMDYFNFKPKFISSILNAITVGKYYPEEKHPISKILFRFYEPVCRWVLKKPKTIILIAILLTISTIPVFFKIGSEFMPPLNEGSILYMPTTLPGISVSEAQKLLQKQDEILKSFPEVERVFGKAGRADISTDPAPFSMMETTVILKPAEKWRKKERWYSSWVPEFLQKILRHIWYDRITWEELISEMDEKMKFSGLVNAWTMPIKARIDMLSTGIRTPIGIKISGSDLKKIEEIGIEIEKIIKDLKGTRSVYAERTTEGYFIDFNIRREVISRYGLSVKEVEDLLMTAIGGANLNTTIEGRERYGVLLRYPRDYRDNVERLKKIVIPLENGMSVLLEQIADIELKKDPGMIRDENGLLTGYVYVDIKDVDIGSYVKNAKEELNNKLKLPPGYSITFSGQYENMLRVRERLKIVLPLTIFIIFILLYSNTRSIFKAVLVMLAVPFSIIGAIWFIYLLGYNISIVVWVGMIALMGLDAETGVFMLLYLDLAYNEFKKNGKLKNLSDLKEAIIYGAVKKVRPKMMTVMAAFMGLLPIMWSLGTGSDLMKRIAAPMIGGLFTSFALELLVYPAVYYLWKRKDFENI